MNISRTFILFFSCVFVSVFAQNEAKDSLSKRWKYQPNLMIGVDVLNSGVSFFSDRKVYQGFISSRIYKNIHAIAEVGFEKNIYQKNNYDAEVNGPFLKLGTFFMLATDYENPDNGFYAGGKIAASTYKQHYYKVPIRGYEGGDFAQSFPSSSQSSFWIEATVGGRVQLFDSPFFIDVNVQPRYLIFTTKQEEIYPMIIPGFGKSSSKFNMGFAWNIAYRF